MEPAEGVQPSSERYRLPALSVMLSRQVIDYQRVWSGWRMLKSRPHAPKARALPLSYTQITSSHSTIIAGMEGFHRIRLKVYSPLCIFLATGVCQTGIWTLGTAQTLVLQPR